MIKYYYTFCILFICSISWGQFSSNLKKYLKYHSELGETLSIIENIEHGIMWSDAKICVENCYKRDTANIYALLPKLYLDYQVYGEKYAFDYLDDFDTAIFDDEVKLFAKVFVCYYSKRAEALLHYSSMLEEQYPKGTYLLTFNLLEKYDNYNTATIYSEQEKRIAQKLKDKKVSVSTKALYLLCKAQSAYIDRNATEADAIVSEVAEKYPSGLNSARLFNLLSNDEKDRKAVDSILKQLNYDKPFQIVPLLESLELNNQSKGHIYNTVANNLKKSNPSTNITELVKKKMAVRMGLTSLFKINKSPNLLYDEDFAKKHLATSNLFLECLVANIYSESRIKEYKELLDLYQKLSESDLDKMNQFFSKKMSLNANTLSSGIYIKKDRTAVLQNSEQALTDELLRNPCRDYKFIWASNLDEVEKAKFIIPPCEKYKVWDLHSLRAILFERKILSGNYDLTKEDYENYLQAVLDFSAISPSPYRDYLLGEFNKYEDKCDCIDKLEERAIQYAKDFPYNSELRALVKWYEW